MLDELSCPLQASSPGYTTLSRTEVIGESLELSILGRARILIKDFVSGRSAISLFPPFPTAYAASAALSARVTVCSASAMVSAWAALQISASGHAGQPGGGAQHRVVPGKLHTTRCVAAICSLPLTLSLFSTQHCFNGCYHSFQVGLLDNQRW